MRTYIDTLLLILTFTFLQGQTVAQPNPNNTIVYADIPKEQEKSYVWKDEWNVFIADAIDRHGTMLLHADSLPLVEIKVLCNDFATATPDQKKSFWALFIASICRFESGFNPKARFQEPPPLNVYSEGLLQLSYGNEKRYPGSRIDPRLNKILNPQVNLETGVIILVRQLRKRKTLFTTKHFYWSVLTNKKDQIRKFFSNHYGRLVFCH